MADSTNEFDDCVKAFFVKYSWDTYQSKHLKFLKIPAYDLETSLAVDEVCRITDRKVSDLDCECLSKALMAMKPYNLKQIYLMNNNIGDTGCAAVAQAAAVLPSLEILNLARNHIGDAGLIALSDKAANAPIWQLVLTENELISDAGALALAQAVNKAPAEAFAKLRWLFLDSTSIGDKGVEALANAMVMGFRSIERLALHNCKLTKSALGQLTSAIERGALAKCQFLYVQKNDFDLEGKQILKAAAKPRGIKVHLGWPPPLLGVDYG
jgi:Ran GTPase-activating protein (RanGAP) involved in mRNA processing and transport